MNKMGLYWWGHGRMPMEKKEVITEEMTKRFFAAVEKKMGKSIKRTRDALEWVEIHLRMARAFWHFSMTRLQTLRKFVIIHMQRWNG